MVKYAIGFSVVAMVSHIPVKSHIPGNDVTKALKNPPLQFPFSKASIQTPLLLTPQVRWPKAFFATLVSGITQTLETCKHESERVVYDSQ